MGGGSLDVMRVLRVVRVKKGVGWIVVRVLRV